MRGQPGRTGKHRRLRDGLWEPGAVHCSGRGGVAFLNRLKVDATSVVAINSALSLNANETKNITTQPYLPFGTHRLTLALDDDNNVAESDETPASNVKTVTYVLQGPCGAPPNPLRAAPKK